MKKRIIIIVFIILFVTVALLVYFGQKNNREKGLYYSGTIETTQANLSFQVPGRVSQVNIQEGQSVTKGQIIAELDRAEFESRYEQAKANLDRAQKTKQQLSTVLDISRKTLPSEVARATANVKSVKDTLKNTENNYRRFEELFSNGVVTEKERDTLKLAYEVAKSRLAESESVLKLAQGNLTRIDAAKQDIEVATAQINSINASLNQASIQLAYTQLKSPIDGIITSRNIEPGETVNSG